MAVLRARIWLQTSGEWPAIDAAVVSEDAGSGNSQRGVLRDPEIIIASDHRIAADIQICRGRFACGLSIAGAIGKAVRAGVISRGRVRESAGVLEDYRSVRRLRDEDGGEARVIDVRIVRQHAG